MPRSHGLLNDAAEERPDLARSASPHSRHAAIGRILCRRATALSWRAMVAPSGSTEAARHATRSDVLADTLADDKVVTARGHQQ